MQDDASGEKKHSKRVLDGESFFCRNHADVEHDKVTDVAQSCFKPVRIEPLHAQRDYLNTPLAGEQAGRGA